MTKPTVGRIVHYYPGKGDSPEQWNNSQIGQPIAAVITRVWSDTCVNLRMFVDGPYTPQGFSVMYDEQCGERSWSWPPKI